MIVLGARVFPDGSPSAALEDRLRCALDLHRQGKVQRILVSGEHGSWLLSQGVPVEDIFWDHAGFRTYDTMERARQIFLVADALICTQLFHLHRSVYLARAAGIDAHGVIADRRGYPARHLDARRETLARARAVLDVLSPLSRPRFLGEPVPIDGSASASHDPRSRTM